MEIAIYQIDPGKDEDSVLFSDYEQLRERQGKETVDAAIYGRVFEGTVAESGLEDVYRVFNWEKPEGYRGRSMSVSDIVEVRDPGTGASDFYYCDTIGFRKVAFEPEKAAPMKPVIRVVLCEPGRTARTAEIGTELEDLQQAVGGFIETYYPFSEDVCIVCNDEGKLNGMSPCRAVYGEDREVRDIMALMQHYGLATRLMDWSKSPLIAAYFATEKPEKRADGNGYADACIWILWPSILNQDQIKTSYIYPMDSTTVEEMLAKAFKSQPEERQGYNWSREVQNERVLQRRHGRAFDTGEFQPRGYEKIVACEPVEYNLRMYSQQACFTVHDTIEKIDGTIVPKLSEIAERLEKENNRVTARVIIPHRAKETFRKELAMLGITESFIYPDMDHLSTDIKGDLLKKSR